MQFQLLGLWRGIILSELRAKTKQAFGSGSHSSNPGTAQNQEKLQLKAGTAIAFQADV